jgi:hypothetical protein
MDKTRMKNIRKETLYVTIPSFVGNLHEYIVAHIFCFSSRNRITHMEANQDFLAN